MTRQSKVEMLGLRVGDIADSFQSMPTYKTAHIYANLIRIQLQPYHIEKLAIDSVEFLNYGAPYILWSANNQKNTDRLKISIKKSDCKNLFDLANRKTFRISTNYKDNVRISPNNE